MRSTRAAQPTRSTRSPAVCDLLEPRTLLAAALLKDINTHSPSSNPHSFVDLDGTLLFRANDGVHGEEWWRSDGTPQGTHLLKDIDPRASESRTFPAPRSAAVANGRMFFAGYTPATGTELWATDGTEAGTAMVKDLTPGTASGAPYDFVARGDTVFFAAGDQLWKTDGSADGTVPVGTFRGTIKPLAAIGDRLIFQAAGPGPTNTGNELWATDGTPAGTVFLKDINPGPAGSDPGTRPATARVDTLPADQFLVAGGVMYFAATTDGREGRELWRTDGTPEGTRLAADAVPGPAGSHPGFIAEHDGSIYFTANNPDTLRLDLYRLGADRAATAVHTLSAGVPWSLASTGEDLFYVTFGTQGAPVLFALNESGSGMTELKQFSSWHRSASPSFIRLGGATYFGIGSGMTAGFPTFELWETRGTTATTRYVAGFVRVTSAAQPELLSIGGTLYFAGSDGVGAEPFRSDGTFQGTRMVFDVNPAPTQPSNPTRPVELNGRWLFAASEQGGVTELWVTDGTAAETRKLLAPATGASFFVSKELVEAPAADRIYSAGTVWNGRLYFYGTHRGTYGLFSSDGTPEGTRLVHEPYPRAASTGRSLVPFNGRLYFVAKNNLSGDTLWSTDGTAAGTRPVREIGQIRSEPWSRLTAVGDALYFAASDGTATGYELWQSDGTWEGTVLVKDIHPRGGSDPGYFTAFGGHVYFSAYDPLNGRELWRSDGTADGTVLVADVYPGGTTPTQDHNGNPANLTVVDGRLLFEATDFGPVPGGFSTYRPGIWVSDGTTEGTARLTDPAFSPFQIAPYHLTEAGGVGYFFRQRREAPPEMWRTDGTPQGTSLVHLFITAGFPPFATPVGRNGSTLYVRAGEYQYGSAPEPSGASELWASDGTADGTRRLFSGGITAFPSNAVFANGRVLFTADDGVHGTELWWAFPSEVAGRHVFYNNSAFDGQDPAANPADAGAVATDKEALRAGTGPGSFRNVTGYSKGINGVMVDLTFPDATALSADDFEFRVGTSGDPATWPLAPAPRGITHSTAGASDRFTIVWADGAIKNQWLQVTVKATDNTGLTRPDVFYFGNLIGETGDGAGGRLAVTMLDFLRTRRALSPQAAVTNAYDFNRDGRVSVLDLALSRANQSRTLGAIAATAPTLALEPSRPWDESADDRLK